MMLRQALRLYAGLGQHPLSGNEARAATDRLHRTLQYHEWGVDELRRLIEREVAPGAAAEKIQEVMG